MYNNYDYPMGADNEKAPWNQHENDEHEFDVIISQTLSKETTVLSKDYIEEFDEEGGYYSDDTSEINWSKEYNEQHYTPLELINVLKEFCQDILNKGDIQKDYNLGSLIKECEGWSEDEIVIEEN